MALQPPTVGATAVLGVNVASTDDANAALAAVTGFVDATNAAVAVNTTAITSNTDSITTLLARADSQEARAASIEARLDEQLNLLRHKLRQAGVF